MNTKPSTAPQKARGKKGKPDGLYNILTIIFILLTLLSCGVVFSVFSNPYIGFNPFPPNTPVPPTITSTITPIPLPATWTLVPTIQPTATSTPRPTFTIQPTNTPFSMVTPPTATTSPTPSRTTKPVGLAYGVTVQYFDSTTFRADTSCGDFIIAGQALDTKNTPVTGLIVKIGGSVPGKSFASSSTTLTGIVPAYGPSGFEFALGIPPESSAKTLWIQLFDQSGAPLSEQFYLTTYNDCAKNLLLIRFTQK
jgi:hypothetical protein